MKRTIPILALAASTLFYACKKDETSAARSGKMQVRMTDAPGLYEHVFIEIVGMEVHFAGGVSWVPLLVNPGMYDLLELQNGVDTVLAPPQVIPAGHITQLRMILGNNNYVIDSTGTTIALKTPSGQTSGLKININETVPVGMVYDVLLDFDAGKSILEQGNGDLMLKPVIQKL